MDNFLTLGVSLGLGLLIGLQRERSDAHVGGIRTFPLISLFGTLCGLLALHLGWGVLLAGFLTAFGVLALSNFLRFRSEAIVEPGQTTEVAALLTFAIGAYLVFGPWPVAFVTTGIVVILLHLKAPMHKLVQRMGEHDVSAVMQFAVITLIVLPLLPNRTFGPYEVLNPFDIWRMVVLIVGISLCGYVAYKIWGQKAGAFLGGVLGGIISSTAATASFARRSKDAPGAHGLTIFVIMVASTIAYARVLIEIAAVTPSHIRQLAPPLGAMLAWMGILSLMMLWFTRGQRQELPEPANPAELKSALVFGAIYAVVIFAVGAAKAHLAPSALYGIALISGLTDMDAITLSIARLVEQKRVDPHSAWKLILVASLANLVFKGGAAVFLGGWQFARRLLPVFALGIAGGIVLLLLWPT